jgi:uncharacterized protein
MHYDVLFHVDQDAQKLEMALTNVSNYLAGLPSEHFIAVLVVNGPAIQLMGKEDVHAATLQELAARGLEVRVCQNAMRHFNLTPEWLNPVCRIVPAGVIEIVDLQRKGFAYIKP